MITNFYFEKYTGSELHTLEIAKLFAKRGYDVTIAVFSKAYPLLEKAQNIRVVACMEEELPYLEYDIIFAQHYAVLDYLCCRYTLSYKKMIVSKLGVSDASEHLPFCVSKADLIFCVSEECADAIYKSIGKDARVRVFKNSVSEEFFAGYEETTKVRTLRKIAVISNHIPEEVQALAEKFSDICIDYIGVQGTPRFVDAEVLKEYDLVITIGRTVQQCFALGIPVYVYDRFGGPGYINETNFALAEQNNFSGRGGFGFKTAVELTEDILGNYESNLKYLDKLHTIAEDEYSYDKNFARLYEELLPETAWVEKTLEHKQGLEKQRLTFYTEIVPRANCTKFANSQIYFDYGKGFGEADSIKWLACEDYYIVRTLVVDKGVKALRFDPCDIPSECRISTIRINGKEKEVYCNVQRTFWDCDPQFIIPLSEEEQADEKLQIVFEYQFKELVREALLDEIASARESAEESAKEVEQLKNRIAEIKEYYKVTPKNVAKRIRNFLRR